MRARVILLTTATVAAIGTTAVTREPTAVTRDKAIYGHVSHAGWVVGDLDAVIAAWRRLGVTDVMPIREVEMPMVHRGSPVTARIRLAIARFANAEIHWIEPIGGDHAFAAFLDAHGDGIHHLAFRVPVESHLDTEAASFAAAGVPVLQSGGWETPSGPARFVYLDTASEGGGITLELEYNPHPRDTGRAPGNAEPFGTVTQYAMLVKDIRAVSRFYERLGFGPIAFDRNVSLDRRYRGAPGGFEMLLGFTRWADVTFEWIEPLVGPSVYDEHLERHGEGFHHLAFNVPDLDAAVAALEARGARVTMSGGWDSNGHQGRFAYFDTERHGGVALELLWNKPRAN